MLFRFLFISCISAALSYNILKINNLSSKILKSSSTILTGVLIGCNSGVFPIQNAFAVSGGGKDYATKDLRETDFSGQDLSGKDFTQCDATGVKFVKAKLSGSRFYRANLKEADFSDANLIGASLEDTLLVGAKFKGAILKDSYLSASIVDTDIITDADFTDAQLPDFARKKLCDRKDATGTNPVTGESTRDTLFCE